MTRLHKEFKNSQFAAKATDGQYMVSEKDSDEEADSESGSGEETKMGKFKKE